MYCIVFEITRLSQTKGKNKTTTTMLKQFKNPNKKVVESGKPEFYSTCIDDRSLSRLVTGTLEISDSINTNVNGICLPIMHS